MRDRIVQRREHFLRAKALNRETWAGGRPALERYPKVNVAAQQRQPPQPADKTEIAKLLTELKFDKSDQGSGFVRLHQNRGSLLKRPDEGSSTSSPIVAERTGEAGSS